MSIEIYVNALVFITIDIQNGPVFLKTIIKSFDCQQFTSLYPSMLRKHECILKNTHFIYIYIYIYIVFTYKVLIFKQKTDILIIITDAKCYY